MARNINVVVRTPDFESQRVWSESDISLAMGSPLIRLLETNESVSVTKKDGTVITYSLVGS